MSAAGRQTEHDLVLQSLEGGTWAFRQIYAVHFSRLYARVRLSVPPAEVEDILQEVWKAAVEQLPQFRGESSLATWLSGIARNKIADYHRAAAVRARDLRRDHIRSEAVPPEPSREEYRESVLDRVRVLPEADRDLIVAVFLDELSLSEVAERMDLSLEAVRSRYKRAIRRLRELRSA